MPGTEATPPVLVVDDNPDVRECLCELLQIKGYKAVGAKDGKAALECLDAGVRPGLIILDLTMPRMNGWEFSAYVAHNPALAAIPLLVVTATPGHPPANASVTLKKPVHLDILMNFVAQYCGRSDPEAKRSL